MKQQSIAAIKRYRTRKLASLITKSYYLHRRNKKDLMYSNLCEEFIALGGVYVKFLQGVMLQSEVMRRWSSPNRLRIFENLDCEPLDVVQILRHELSPEQLAKITTIQPEPFAAGSFGQVYYGQHINGKPIIIKVLRPMVRELLKYDLRLLGAFSKRFFMKLYPRNMELDMDEAIREFKTATMRETDYIEEARFASEQYQDHKGNPQFIIPETFTDLCTPNIIVQEYIDGLSVAQLVKLKEQGVDIEQYVQEYTGSNLDKQLVVLGFESLNGMFNLNRIQGDPHPGNVRLMTNNRVGLIDFGISAPAPRNKAAFLGLIEEWNRLYSDDQNIVGLFEQFMRFFVSDLYRALKRLSSLRNDTAQKSNYTSEVGKVAQEAFSNVMGTKDIAPILNDGRVLQIFNQIINKGNRFGLVMKLEDSEIIRAAQTYITLVDSLGRRTTVLPRVFDRLIEQVNQDHPELRHHQDDTMSMSQAIETVSRWLERVAIRDPALFRQLMQRIKLSTIKPVQKEEAIADA
jgi:serine/threonine protein kinase